MRYDGRDNLNPLGDRCTLTKEQQREIQRKGGIASAAAKKRKKSMLECAKAVLEADMPDKLKAGVEKTVQGLEDGEDTLFTAAVAAMMNKAINGNVHAFNAIKDLVQQIEDQRFVSEMAEDPLSKALEEIGREL